jgi:hypothetical protein
MPRQFPGHGLRLEASLGKCDQILGDRLLVWIHNIIDVLQHEALSVHQGVIWKESERLVPGYHVQIRRRSLGKRLGNRGRRITDIDAHNFSASGNLRHP